MPRVILVRHGRAAAAWDRDADPGLDDVGRAQAAAMADGIAASRSGRDPLRIVVSPLRRTRETAATLETRWGVVAHVDPNVGEIPSPTPDLAARGAWLRETMVRTWADVDEWLRTWRAGVLEGVRSSVHAATTSDGGVRMASGAVVVTHFVAINVVVGAATRDDRVVCCSPDYCSLTTVELDGDGSLHLVELGAQSRTLVQ